METILSCVLVAAGMFVCPDDQDSVVEVDSGTEVVLAIDGTDRSSAEGWDCDVAWCVFDYGLAEDDDTVEVLPAGSTCPDAPASCDTEDQPPSGGKPKPKTKKKIWIKTRVP